MENGSTAYKNRLNPIESRRIRNVLRGGHKLKSGQAQLLDNIDDAFDGTLVV